MYYHASPIANIKILEPRISNHDVPLVYLSAKRENVLVYLSNAVEKYCKETGFSYTGNWSKWGPYGFDKSGKLVFEEYYPNALYETYAGVAGYIYSVKDNENLFVKPEIPDCVVSKKPVPVESVEYIPNAYEAILRTEREGKIGIVRYKEFIGKREEWLRRIIKDEYDGAVEHPEYRHFLQDKFGLFLRNR
ncbi:MAG: hypothetical protein ACI4HQ_03565 [Acetatifactor sp.]